MDPIALAGKSAASSELKSAFCLINMFDISINYSENTAALHADVPWTPDSLEISPVSANLIERLWEIENLLSVVLVAMSDLKD